jgi:hypothetical protein
MKKCNPKKMRRGEPKKKPALVKKASKTIKKGY